MGKNREAMKEGVQLTVRITHESLTAIDELVKLHNRNMAANASRQSVIRDLIARGIRSLPRKNAAESAKAPSASESIPSGDRPSGEG